MAVPKRKTSKARKGKRRSHMAITLPALDYCPQCHSPKLAHQGCPACGSYGGREVMAVKSEKRS